jgi:hypothetical protein
VTACIAEPISWPRLERFALGAADPAIASHVAACPACRRCLDAITGDAIELPRLVVPAALPRRAQRRWWLAPALAAAAAAVVLVVVLRPPLRPPSGPDAALRVAIKGIGELALELVRERGGAIAYDARSFVPGDRWKLVISCPPGAAAAPIAIDVSVADGITVDHPLAAAQLACGNRVVVPGAFAITGERPNRVCARIGAGADVATACATLVPEAAAPAPR